MSIIFGKRLRELRTAQDLTQDDAAYLIGISRISLARYESGDQSPTTDNLEKIADYFRVSIDYLLGRIDTPYYITSTADNEGNPITTFARKSPMPPEDVKKHLDHAAQPDAESYTINSPEDLDKVPGLTGYLKELARKAFFDVLDEERESDPRTADPDDQK